MITRHHLDFHRRLGPDPAGPDRDRDASEHRFVAEIELTAAQLTGPIARLHIGGVATWSTLSVNGHSVLESKSMFAASELELGDRLRPGPNRFEIVVHPLAELLAGQPRTPRARWRTRLVEDNALRWARTSLLGRCPGFAPGPPVIGPWRPVVLELGRGPAVRSLSLRAELEAMEGRLSIAATIEGAESVTVAVSGPTGRQELTMDVVESHCAGRLTLPAVAPWWPHTHGNPALYDVRLLVDGQPLPLPGDGTRSDDSRRRVGFRSITATAPADSGADSGADDMDIDIDIDIDGIALHVNGVPVFCRGALWTPSAESDETAGLTTMAELGLNMVRMPGTAQYESDAFHDRCDELGLLVWQDLMFANLDLPLADPGFRAEVEAEIVQELRRIAGHPSLAVVCGSSEMEQQAAMFGRDPALARSDLFTEFIPKAVSDCHIDAIWVPSAPCGGDLPFRTDRGVANYFGVGGYRRPLADVRRAGVRFAAECLAFGNVGDGPLPAPLSADWKRGVPRDNGASWDFDDVREFYLSELYGPAAAALRFTDPDRWIALSREVTGEVMAAVFGEWRRAESGCGGGLVLWWRDVIAGAGWGILDSAGRPKACAWHLKRALAPVAVWLTEEGQNGIDVHVANDEPAPFGGSLRVGLYQDGRFPIAERTVEVSVPAHASVRFGVEELIGRFVDASYAYRFGPPAHSVTVASLHAGELRSQSFHFPVGRPLLGRSADELGAQVSVVSEAEDSVVLSIRAESLLWAARIDAEGFAKSDDAFSVEPGHARVVTLTRLDPKAELSRVRIRAINLTDELRV